MSIKTGKFHVTHSTRHGQEQCSVACIAEYPGYQEGEAYRAAFCPYSPGGRQSSGLWAIYKRGVNNPDRWFLHDRLTPDEFQRHFKPLN